MYAKYNEIVVVDLEATCWGNRQEQGKQVQDIIEVGVALLDVESLAVIKRGFMFVRPLRSSVSEYCTNLTTITQEDVAKAPIFTDVTRWLKDEFNTIERPWASYGAFDQRLFTAQCADMNVRYPFSGDYINVKPLATLALGLTKSLGTGRTLERLGITFEGTQHRAVDDANNVALILARIIGKMRG